MPSLPTSSDVHVDRILTNVMINYAQDYSKSVYNRVCPVVPVQKQSDAFFQWNLDDLLRDEARERGPGSEAPIAGQRLANDTYYAKVEAIAKLISDQEVANADDPLNLDQHAVNFVTSKLMLRMEKKWAQAQFTTGVWTGSTSGGDITPGNLWNDYVLSTPVLDITTQMDAMEEKTSYRPNKLVLSRKVFSTLKNHPNFLERIKYSQIGIVDAALMASTLGVDEVIVSGVTENTAAEGLAKSMSFIAGKHALLVYTPPAPSISVPSASYTFSWAGLVGSEGSGMRIKRFERPEKSSMQVEGEIACASKVTAPDLGVFFSSVIP